MRGSRSHVRQRLAGLLLGLGLLLVGCDAGAVFDLGQSGAPAAPEEQVASEEPAAPEEEPAVPDEEPAASEEEPAASEGAAGEDAVTGSPFDGTDGFYVPPSQAADWVAANPDDPRADVIRDRIAQVPASVWLTGGSGVGDVVDTTVAAAAAENTVPVLVAYNVPGRDCGQFSAGGAGGADAYRAWIDEFAAAIGDRPAIVIVEPDALAGIDCLSEQNQQDRLDLLRYAVEQFAASAPNAWTYLDAGHAQWQPAGVMAERLQAAGVATARGFALNVSNYYTTAENEAYGDQVNAALGEATPFVVDTSRNGNGSNGEWCNPAGRAIGVEPNVHELGAGLEMELWVKLPGESDGDCGIGAGTSAGQFVPDIAFELAGG
jgi:endoglucanase